VLRCPLCAQEIVVHSEAECETHIASCSQFHAEYAPGASRAGLVSGFQAATVAVSGHVPAPAKSHATAALRCDAYAAALLPLIPAAMNESGGSLSEAVDLVGQLAAALVSSATDDDTEFGNEELISVTLGPFIAALGEDRGKGVLRGVVSALEALQRAVPASADVAESLKSSLLQHMQASGTPPVASGCKGDALQPKRPCDEDALAAAHAAFLATNALPATAAGSSRTDELASSCADGVARSQLMLQELDRWLQQGTFVRLCGLSKGELNGCCGVVTGSRTTGELHITSRYPVQLCDGAKNQRRLAVRPLNLRPMEPSAAALAVDFTASTLVAKRQPPSTDTSPWAHTIDP